MSAAVRLKKELDLLDGDLDEDLSVALVALITSAVRDEHATRTLAQLVQATEGSDLAELLEPLTLIPVLLSSTTEGAQEMLDVMGTRSNAKEVVMAAQEVLEHLELATQSDDYSEVGLDELSEVRQIGRILRLYSQAVPRVPKRKKSASEIIQPLFSELESLILQLGGVAVAEDGQALIVAASKSVMAVYEWIKLDSSNDADERSRTRNILYSFLNSVVEACANSIDAGLARKAFREQFSRLAMPSSDETVLTDANNIIHEAWFAMETLELTPHTFESSPSLSSLIMLAHTPAYVFSITTLTSFLPILLHSIQCNTALDESLSVLISSVVPLQSQSPRPELSPDLIVPFVHVLPPLASVHPDPSTRHHTYRLLSAVLSLAPSPLRLQLLHILVDSGSSPQMRVAAVGLVKEAVLEALSLPVGSEESKRNVFVSPLFLQTLGPVILRTDPLDLLFSGQLQPTEFLDTAEPLRLVECLALYYVMLYRDIQNRTGVRDRDNLMDVKRTLLEPLSKQLKSWSYDELGAAPHSDDSVMQLAILDMWLERVSGAVEDICRT